MTPKDVALLSIPIIVSLISGAFAFFTASRVAKKNASAEHDRVVAEHRQTDSEMMANLNSALQSEISKLRADRDEDEKKHHLEIRQIEIKNKRLEDRCSRQEDDFRSLVLWARTVVGILRRPDVAGLLAAGAIEIPAPPSDIERKGR